MNCTIDSTTTEHAGVGGIDDSFDLNTSNVPFVQCHLATAGTCCEAPGITHEVIRVYHTTSDSAAVDLQWVMQQAAAAAAAATSAAAATAAAAAAAATAGTAAVNFASVVIYIPAELLGPVPPWPVFGYDTTKSIIKSTFSSTISSAAKIGSTTTEFHQPAFRFFFHRCYALL
jgi:hypothetical protein